MIAIISVTNVTMAKLYIDGIPNIWCSCLIFRWPCQINYASTEITNVQMIFVVVVYRCIVFWSRLGNHCAHVYSSITSWFVDTNCLIWNLIPIFVWFVKSQKIQNTYYTNAGKSKRYIFNEFWKGIEVPYNYYLHFKLTELHRTPIFR